MITQLTFVPGQKTFTAYFTDEQPLTSIGPLSKINFFIGANNSGKSRLLREILKEFYRYPVFKPDDPFAGLPDEETAPSFTLSEYKKEVIIKILSDGIQELEALGVKEITSDLIIDLMAREKHINEQEIQDIYMRFDRLRDKITRLTKSQWGNDENEQILENKEAILKVVKDLLPRIADLLPIPIGVSFRVNYIPILRSLRPFMAGVHDKITYSKPKRSEFPKIEGPVIANRIFWDYFTTYAKDNDPQSGREALYDGQLQIDNFFTGETLFKKVQELRNDVENQRKILTDFEDFLSKQFFNGQKVALNAISPQGVENIYVKIGDEAEYPIYELGDGIQAIILLTFPLYFYGSRTGHILFYEEPELYLHPGMQRIFIEAILHFPNVQVFIATHSNHFLDTSVDYLYVMEMLTT